MSKKENKIKGHGYLRKTKLGLASGIVLGATLLVGAGVASADEVTAPSNGNVATAQTNDTKEVVVDNDLTKVAEEAKKSGLQVDKEPTKNIGTANTETEAEALQKKAEAEVDAQKKTIQEAQKKFDEENKKVDGNLSDLRKAFSKPNIYNGINNNLAYTQDEDFSKGNVTIGKISSSKGKVDFVDTATDKVEFFADAEKRSEDDKIFSSGITDKPKEVTYSMSKNGNYVSILDDNSPISDKKHVKGIPVYLSPNETVTYQVDFGENSEMAKLGIKSKLVKLTLKSSGVSNSDKHTIGFLTPYGSSLLSGGVVSYAQRDELNGQPFLVESSYDYLDKNGKVISKKELGKNWFTKGIAKGSSVDETFFPDDTHTSNVNAGDTHTYTNNIAEIKIGGETFYKVTRQGTPVAHDYGLFSQFASNATKPQSDVNPEFYTKKQSEKVAYHLVSYNVNKPKATNNADKLKKGSIVQVFVDEGGKEIAPKTNTGEKPVDETVKLTHPNEITFKGKTYTFTKQDKTDPTKIPNGSETITYIYKLKEEPKPVPTPAPTPTPKPTPVPTPTPVENPTTIHIDGNTGKEISPKEDGTKPFKNIDGYEPAPKDSKNVVDPKGKTVRVYNIIKKGNVEVRYVKDDASKTVLQNPVADTVGGKVGSDYDTTDHKPKTITKDGVTYELVRTEGAEKGKVVEGKTVVTYVYRQSVEPTTVHVDEDGNRLAPPEKGTKPFKNIDGFEPSPKNPKNVENPKGETVRVYKAVKGDVEVRYVKDDKERTPLKEPVADTTQAKVGTKYDTTDHKPVTITKDGVTYELVRTEGTEKGNVAKGKTVVTYVYREVQKPITIHVDKDGNPVAPKEDGTKPFKEIEGYKPAPKDPKNVEDPKGVTVRVYEKANPEAPQETPKTPQKPEAPKPTAQANVTATLPNTGSEASTALAIAGMGILGLSALAYKKKED